MNWEGNDAIEEVSDNEATVIERRKAALKTRKQLKEHAAHQELINLDLGADESEEAGDSEDEYVEVKEVKEEVKPDKGVRRYSQLKFDHHLIVGYHLC